MADLIAVLTNGRLAERGSHHELMSVDGLYAELFTLQARAYDRVPRVRGDTAHEEG
jgi:ATP-binding cassette subfamily B protein